jgi:TrmH family RNA methyltransferase
VLLEGPRVLREAASAGITLDLVALREGDSCAVDAVRTVTLSRGIFRAVSQTDSPQGVLAIARAQAVALGVARSAATAAGWPLVVLDGVQDPGNVGAIARTAAAAGAPALVVLPGTADPFSPKSVRASAGNIFRLKVARATWPELEGLAGYGAAAEGAIELAGTPVHEAEMLVLGSEAHGLSSPTLRRVSIPMAAGVDSLNVAAAAAILLYEVRRRRGG